MRFARLLACLVGIAMPIPALAAKPVVVIDTSYGKIKVELFEDQAPITVKNFLTYVDDKHYDGLIFHRVIPDFMIQGGGYSAGLDERKTRDPIKNESTNGLKNLRGTLAMARQNAPDSATAQFYINVVDNASLDRTNENPGYCVFGRVIEGMDVVDRIRKVTTTRAKGHEALPIEDIVIRTARRETK